MGQRLNIEILDNGERIANAYYHWSAYSLSAAMLATTAIDKYFELCDEYSNRLELAVAMLVATGGGMDAGELERIKNYQLFMNLRTEVCNNRNDGMIAVTEYGMDATERYEEGRVTINIGTESVRFDVINEYTREEFEEYWEDESFDDLPICAVDFTDIQFTDMPGLITTIEENPGGFRSWDDDYVIKWVG